MPLFMPAMESGVYSMLLWPLQRKTSPKITLWSAAEPSVLLKRIDCPADVASCGGRACRHRPESSATAMSGLPWKVVTTLAPGEQNPQISAEAGALCNTIPSENALDKFMVPEARAISGASIFLSYSRLIVPRNRVRCVNQKNGQTRRPKDLFRVRVRGNYTHTEACRAGICTPAHLMPHSALWYSTLFPQQDSSISAHTITKAQTPTASQTASPPPLSRAHDANVGWRPGACSCVGLWPQPWPLVGKECHQHLATPRAACARHPVPHVLNTQCLTC